ncbi:uncharacterized protein LOC9638755 [Selaginella moellendorffii]|uniref:uncharacterized protein LOC9638755 n=1 Tax=Selaginella moellendorffii TaxID=88036 RepID=UPI000D1CB771|nr:uncharacterized protein LOC9638755 [Selaginella moellendorffii]|eukprot:XP_002993812.2 uncharacterized protein LOC9638755 [Selaginella moellendorffii]
MGSLWIDHDAAEKTRKDFVNLLASRHKDPGPLVARSCKIVSQETVQQFDIPMLRLSREELDQLEEERLVLVTEVGDQGQLPVLIIRRKNGATPSPALVILHSSYSCKDSIRNVVEYFAFHGFTAITIDNRYHGERASSSYQNAMISAWKTGREMPFIFDTVWDVTKLMDYLIQRKDIDSTRIGMTGISLGGMITLYSMAADARIASAVPMIGVQNFSWAVKNNKWQARVGSIPHAFEVAAGDLGKACCDSETVAAVWQRIAPGLMHEFDVHHILKAVFPRPLLILNGKNDPRCPVEGLESCIRETSKIYKAAGHPEKFQFVAEENVGHEITESMMEAAMRWFRNYLCISKL